jgi:hypothetical protein
MIDIGNLAKRINLEFSSAAERDKHLLGGQEQLTAQQQRRLQQLGKVLTRCARSGSRAWNY